MNRWVWEPQNRRSFLCESSDYYAKKKFIDYRRVIHITILMGIKGWTGALSRWWENEWSEVNEGHGHSAPYDSSYHFTWKDKYIHRHPNCHSIGFLLSMHLMSILQPVLHGLLYLQGCIRTLLMSRSSTLLKISLPLLGHMNTRLPLFGHQISHISRCLLLLPLHPCIHIYRRIQYQANKGM